MNRRTLLLSTLSLAAIGGGSWLSLRPANQTTIPGAAMAETTIDPADMVPDMVLGSPDAKVTLTEYASFTCPHCAHFHATVWSDLKKNYIDTGKVKFVYREVYFDKYGLWAAMVARCGGEMRYFGISDMLYDTQKEWLGSNDPAVIGENLRKIGLKAGLTKEELDACLSDNEMAQKMVATYQANATKDEVTATPTLFINETQHSNMTYEDLSKLLDEALNA